MATFSAPTEPIELKSTWNPYGGPVYVWFFGFMPNNQWCNINHIGSRRFQVVHMELLKTIGALLRKLEDTVFKQLDLKMQILRMNDYDLEKTLNDLCVVLDLEPMLDEVQEWGTFAEIRHDAFGERVCSN